MTEDIKYIKGKQELGIKYDWKKIRKRYKALKCPPIYYDPSECPFEDCKYFLGYSARSIGKSMGWLLMGLIMYDMYGTVTEYCRQSVDQVAPMRTDKMFDAILACHYIEKITNGRWNFILYKRRKWYLANLDDNGYIIEEDINPCCSILVVRDSEKYKSGYNAPTGDLIIFDEFVNHVYYQDEFVQFCDLIKSIARDRISPIVVMLSNNIDKESPYFNELEIYEEVRRMTPTDKLIKTTEKGTRIYVEYIAANEEKQKRLNALNTLFFGFKNKRLGSITGEDWALTPKQHLPEGEFYYISRNLYVYHNNRYIRLDIINHYKLGICMFAHWATKTYDDSVILTIADRTDPRYVYGAGDGRLRYTIDKFISNNLIYYQTNDVYAFLANYMKQIHINI